MGEGNACGKRGPPCRSAQPRVPTAFRIPPRSPAPVLPSLRLLAPPVRPHPLVPALPPPAAPPAAHRWPARRSGCGCRLPAPPSTPDQRPRGWGAKRGRGSVRGGARGGPRVPPPPPGPSDGAARRLRVERGARGATVSVRRRRGVGGGLTAWQRGRDPRGRLGGLSVGMGLGGEQSRWAQRDSAVPPRPPGARGSHRGGTATAQHSQQQLQQQQRVDSPQHRQALQHRPQHRRRLLVLPLSLRWVGGSGPCRSVPPAPLPWGYLRGARGAAGRPRRASPPPAPPGRRAERGAARGSAAAPRPRPRPTER